jgi:Anti-sigma factor NepR
MKVLLPGDVEPHPVNTPTLTDSLSARPLNRLSLARIRQGLRAAYEPAINEPLPVRLAELVERLEEQARSRK